MSKRRKGYPSKTKVKRGVRIIEVDRDENRLRHEQPTDMPSNGVLRTPSRAVIERQCKGKIRCVLNCIGLSSTTAAQEFPTTPKTIAATLGYIKGQPTIVRRILNHPVIN
nr:hypothetical protein [uncultured bacterium]